MFQFNRFSRLAVHRKHEQTDTQTLNFTYRDSYSAIRGGNESKKSEIIKIGPAVLKL